MVRPAILAFAIFASATALSAAAETPEDQQACANDANALCPDEIPNHDKVYACLVKRSEGAG